MRKAVVIAIAVGMAALAYRPHHDPLPGFPRIMIWAWERPEKLDSLDPSEAGVAFLACTVHIHGGVVTARPRLQPLVTASGAALMAVVRIETQDPHPDARPDAEHAIIEATQSPGVRALQLDYDAKVSERDFYRSLLADLRRVLPDSMPLSITALASWCQADGWIAGLPVTEAVPMLFRMGAEPYRGDEDFRPELCRSSVGISTDEPVSKLASGRRIYIFHPRSWTQPELRAAIREVAQWR